MLKTIPFIKMHGLGNDFVVIDDFVHPNADWKVHPALSEVGPLTPELARRLCDRRFGIGADQVLWLRRPVDASAHVRMEIKNADGSVAEMCGNGIRAVALYLAEEAHERRTDYRVETLVGILTVRLSGTENAPRPIRHAQVIVDMGAPAMPGLTRASVVGDGELLKIRDREFRFYEVNMGNPHAVIFVPEGIQPAGRDDPAALAAAYGPEIERHPRFPARTNVEFVQVTAKDQIVVRVWERGAGLTLACGTGACAAAVATLATKRAQGRLTVNLPGGDLFISWAGELNDQPALSGAPLPMASVTMEGPAAEVFRGQLFLHSFTDTAPATLPDAGRKSESP